MGDDKEEQQAIKNNPLLDGGDGTKNQVSSQVMDKPKTGRGKKVGIFLLVIILIAGAAGGVYYWQHQKLSQQKVQQQVVVDELNSKISEQKQKLEEMEKVNSEKKAIDTTCKKLTAAQLDSVHAAIGSKNTAALEGYLASKITYIVASSDINGDMTPGQVINSLTTVLGGSASPWNFNIAAVTIDKYKTGQMKDYTKDDTIFGTSANKYFISMRENCSKIDQVFVSSSTDML